MPSVQVTNPTIKGIGAEGALIPGLSVEFYVRTQDNVKANQIIFVVELTLLGRQPPLVSPPVFVRELNPSDEQVRVFFPMSRETINAIELLRVDDVPAELSLRGHCLRTSDRGQTGPEGFTGNTSVKQSQKDWLALLRGMGYSDRWVIELERPKIEGFDSLIPHVEKAADCLLRRDYEGAVHNCRVAWSAVNPLLKTMEAGIASEIDKGSAGEPGEPSKSQRIVAIKESVNKLSQIGAHKESYFVSSEDAYLCYRTTVSVLAYLSTLVAKTKVP